jgi:hypothetical protein
MAGATHVQQGMVVSSNAWVVLMVAVMVDGNDVGNAEIQSSWDGGKRGSLETWSCLKVKHLSFAQGRVQYEGPR